ncbi:MAG: DUF1624 domain-containing protein [Quinella sp. 1Q5]|nr:DUF1624 domain-containing protein [Quinella sp. 1Q5]
MKRIYSLDVLRGLAIFIMVFVDAPPGGIAYPIFIHAPWEGLTFADFAFPGFVFTMGLSAAVSLARRNPSTKKIFRRAAILFAIGIVFNILPSIFAWLIRDDFTGANLYAGTIEHLRIFGILQRLALIYAFGVLLARTIRNDLGIFIAAFALLIFSSLGFHVYAPDNPFDQTHNISRAVDLIFPGENRIYWSTHDPEGLYGTIASTASFLFGFLAGKVILDSAALRDKLFLLAVGSLILLVAGSVWSSFDIVAKEIWTAPFALITSGVEVFLLAALIRLLDARPNAKRFFQPLAAVGMNPLFFFLLPNIALVFISSFPSPAEGMDLYVWFFISTFSHLISPEFGSMIFCLLWCLLWLPIAEVLYKMKVTIKI